MARSWAVMIVRELEKAEKQRRREVVRLEKERYRQNVKAQNAYLKEQAKADKEKYIADQINQAEIMTTKLLNSYDKYSELVDKQLLSTEVFNFDSLKKDYVKKDFKFSELVPIKKSPLVAVANPFPVPKENWLEKIVPSRLEKRLDIIEKNKKHFKEIEDQNLKNLISYEEEYQKELSAYEMRRQEAYKNWEENEQKKMEFLKNQNSEIDKWRKEYLAGKVEAVTAYVDTLFATYNFALDTVVEHQVGYNEYCKKLIVDLHILDKDEIFEAEGYKYIKQRDEYDPVKMKVTALNERMRNLMIEVCMATFHFLFRNNRENIFESIVVNIYYDHICCVSSEVDQISFVKHNFTTRSGIAAFMQLQMRIFKQITRGVIPFEMSISKLD